MDGPADNEIGLFQIQRLKRTASFSMAQGHYHDFYEIYYLLSGERYYFVKDRTYRVKAGDLVFINKYDMHQTTAVGNAEHERILISFRESILEDSVGLLLPFTAPGSVLPLDPAEQSFVKLLLTQMLKEHQEKRMLHETYTKTLLTQLLIFASRRVQQRGESPRPESALHQKLNEMMTYIRDHCGDPLTLEVLSKHFYISPYYLSRSFKSLTGFSFPEFINTVRIREAQRLLRETNEKIADISEQVGFLSQAHFSRVFKRVSNVSPIEYKRSIRMK